MQDFPSVGQIIQKARENNINVIFMIGGNESSIIRSNYYDKLARYLPGGNHKASALSNDSKNIVDIIRDSYRVLLFIDDFISNLKHTLSVIHAIMGTNFFYLETQ